MSYTEIDGIQFHYHLVGPTAETERGVPAKDLVLLHGFGASIFSWRHVIEPLAREHRVLAFDRPGFGLTSRPVPDEWDDAAENPYTLEAAVDQTLRLMDRFDMGSPVMLAHSAGCAVAVTLAARYPSRASALVLEDPAVVRTREAPRWITPILRTEPARRIGPKLVATLSPRAIEPSLKRALHDSELVTPQVVEGYSEPLKDQRWPVGLWEYAAAPRECEARDLLAGLELPTLVIAGREDVVIPYRYSVEVARLVTGATMIPYEQTGHVPHEERPARFVSDVEAFLAKVGG